MTDAVKPQEMERVKAHLWTDDDGKQEWEYFGRDVDCDDCIDAVLVRADVWDAARAALSEQPSNSGDWHASDCAYPPGECDCMPTDAMCRAAVEYANGRDVYGKVPAEALQIEESIYREVWRAMQAVAPTSHSAPVERVQLSDEDIDRIRFQIPTKAVTQRDHEIARAVIAEYERANGIGKGEQA